ncbi:hypothetical protein NC661_13245 [Aquibacillus koreensis]|uniref:Uncharacterized protein n=1 Tax=Aquibacillus koreensis TaxID=279446 RepID=A0A9X3WM53_9BACI|nr:hypothetical protein [Aquibacillus koreensis]MCT2536314.1 hypothetical protein [Aquibacillus koreensis]MDC3421335.1 hypothetical protein [Aquibacillus koreensis]
MDILILVLIFMGIFALYDAIRKVNNNITEQTEELKKLREDLRKNLGR